MFSYCRYPFTSIETYNEVHSSSQVVFHRPKLFHRNILLYLQFQEHLIADEFIHFELPETIEFMSNIKPIHSVSKISIELLSFVFDMFCECINMFSSRTKYNIYVCVFIQQVPIFVNLIYHSEIYLFFINVLLTAIS